MIALFLIKLLFVVIVVVIVNYLYTVLQINFETDMRDNIRTTKQQDYTIISIPLYNGHTVRRDTKRIASALYRIKILGISFTNTIPRIKINVGTQICYHNAAAAA